MGDLAQAQPSAMYYKAFISYSHEADKTVAAALQSSLHKIAKPWYRLPLIRVCRDETSLAANPTLWRTIESELARSDYLILVASPGSAKSEGVSLEIEWWLENHGTQNLLFVVTGGELKWDRAAQKFSLSSAIPGKLATRLSAEPLFAGLRFAMGPPSAEPPPDPEDRDGFQDEDGVPYCFSGQGGPIQVGDSSPAGGSGCRSSASSPVKTGGTNSTFGLSAVAAPRLPTK